MGLIISAFEADDRYGGGVITKKLAPVFGGSYNLIARRNKENRLKRALRTLFIWIRTPYLHPIFCAFGPPPSSSPVVLNFSQTFNLVLRYPQIQFDIVAHDLIIQKRFFMNWWVRTSEGRIFDAASRIYVLSEKDRKLVRRFYGITDQRIVNVFKWLYPNIVPFKKLVRKHGKFHAIFLGSIARSENYRGLAWFYENVFTACSEAVEVTCIGETDMNLSKHFPEFNFIGFVDSISESLLRCDFTIAPILDGAGIKIKVLDSLIQTVPVIGTPKAFEGLGRPNWPHCSTDANTWIELIKGEIIEYDYKPPI